MRDTIYRADAIEAFPKITLADIGFATKAEYRAEAIKNINALPSAEATCATCADRAMCIMSAPDGKWKACKDYRAEAVQIPIKLEKRYPESKDEDITDAFMRGYLAGRSAAETVQGWIPCSERLPNESGDYLCTIPLDANETYTEVLTFHKGKFYEDDDEWGATYHDDVIAWMPLPKPYREDGEDDGED